MDSMAGFFSPRGIQPDYRAGQGGSQPDQSNINSSSASSAATTQNLNSSADSLLNSNRNSNNQNAEPFNSYHAAVLSAENVASVPAADVGAARFSAIQAARASAKGGFSSGNGVASDLRNNPDLPQEPIIAESTGTADSQLDPILQPVHLQLDHAARKSSVLNPQVPSARPSARMSSGRSSKTGISNGSNQSGRFTLGFNADGRASLNQLDASSNANQDGRFTLGFNADGRATLNNAGASNTAEQNGRFTLGLNADGRATLNQADDINNVGNWMNGLNSTRTINSGSASTGRQTVEMAPAVQGILAPGQPKPREYSQKAEGLGLKSKERDEFEQQAAKMEDLMALQQSAYRGLSEVDNNSPNVPSEADSVYGRNSSSSAANDFSQYDGNGMINGVRVMDPRVSQLGVPLPKSISSAAFAADPNAGGDNAAANQQPYSAFQSARDWLQGHPSAAQQQAQQQPSAAAPLNPMVPPPAVDATGWGKTANATPGRSARSQADGPSARPSGPSSATSSAASSASSSATASATSRGTSGAASSSASLSATSAIVESANDGFEKLVVNVDSVLNMIPASVFGIRQYCCNARYPNEALDARADKRSTAVKANAGLGRCLDCVLHRHITLPYDPQQSAVIVSIWEVDKEGDTLVGEATVPLDDPRIVMTNPWPLRGPVTTGVETHATLLTLHVSLPSSMSTPGLTLSPGGVSLQ